MDSNEFLVLRKDIEDIKVDIREIKKDIQKLFRGYGELSACLQATRNGLGKIEANVDDIEKCIASQQVTSHIQLRSFIFDLTKMFVAALLAVLGVKFGTV